MYHIWAPQCQIQLRRGQDADRDDRTVLRPAPPCRIELADAVGSGLGRMEESDNLLLCQSGLDPGESGRDQPGFACQGERIEGGTFEQLPGAGDEVRREANLPLEAAGECLALDRVGQSILRCGDPDAAPGQLALE